MKIGELAAATNTPIETIRFYEREHLLPAAARTAGNYRIYGAPHVERLSFIRHCRSLDMALDEIRVLLRFKDAPHEACGQVNALLDDHIGHVAERIAELKVLAKQLKLLREQCHEARAAQDCGILHPRRRRRLAHRTRPPLAKVLPRGPLALPRAPACGLIPTVISNSNGHYCHF